MQNLEQSINTMGSMEKPMDLIDKLTNIGIQLSAEKDVDCLIRLILEECINIVGCDAGSIYIKESINGMSMLRFSHVLNKTTEFPYESTYLPMDKKVLPVSVQTPGSLSSSIGLVILKMKWAWPITIILTC